MRDPTVLPEPTDDGAADHLRGMKLPPVALPATDGTTVTGEEPRTLDLPTFEVEGMTLIQRVTRVRDGVIDDVIYPVFPPDQGAAPALARI